MQVYKPIIDPSDPRYGLNPYRHYINTILALLPVVLASLAFLPVAGGYVNGGSVCWLPIRPIWVRVLLSWLPRYIIFVSVSVLSTVVYWHVGHQLKAFHSLWSLQLKAAIPRTSSPSPRFEQLELNRPRKVSFYQDAPLILPSFQPSSDRRRSSLPEASSLPVTAAEKAALSRYPSKRRHTTDVGSLAKHQTLISHFSKSQHSPIQLGRREQIFLDDLPVLRRESVVTNATISSTPSRKSCQTMPPILPSMLTSQDELVSKAHPHQPADLERGVSNTSAQATLEARRRTIILQMRMNFVYPIVYVALWAIPFVLDCMQYREKYAIDAPPVLAALSTLCISSMGFANALCFLFREKPWHDVGMWPQWVLRYKREKSEAARVQGNANSQISAPTSPSTRRSSTSGSFFWQTALYFEPSRAGLEARTRQSVAAKRPWSAKHRAFERLALERADRLEVTQQQQANRGSLPRSIESTDPSSTMSHSTAVIAANTGVGIERSWWDKSTYYRRQTNL
jgi:G protein-coupled receptor GPR1